MKQTVRNTLLAILTFSCIVAALRGSGLAIPSGTWQPMGNLSAQRAGASAALLQDGRILVTGGTGASGAVPSADFFNPDGTVSPAPAMFNARAGHASVILQDGRVLVAGGVSAGGSATSTAEIFDPVANSWTFIGAGMTEARSGATAAVLQDGRVLIAGGQNGTLISSTVEIFDPSTGAFSAAGMMSSPRTQHAMTVLHDGRVLIVGGSNGTAPVASTDIFDPVAGTISAGPSLSVARFGHSATTLMNGIVVVIGGNNGNADPTQVDVTPTEILDPSAATPAFTTVSASLATPREGHLAIALPNNGSVLIAGGTSAGAAVASAELFTPQVSSAGAWTYSFATAGTMSTARSATAGSANQVNAPSTTMQRNGIVAIAGGNDASGNALNTTEAYGYPTVQTDQSDYAPGTTVTITGSGFQPGETVNLQLVESPLIDTPGPFSAIADVNGNIANTQFVPDAYDVNVRFYLTAAGATSGFIAQNTFTDAGDNTSISVSCDSNPILNNGTSTCTAVVNNIQAGAPHGYPQGTVSFTLGGPGTAAGSFSASPCTLTQIGSTVNSSCSATFSATATGNGNIKVGYTTGSGSKWQPSNNNGSPLPITVSPSATLTVTKTVVPSSDSGLFNLRIDGNTAGTGANVGNGGTTGAVLVSTGTHTVSETAATGTSLANYSATIGGACASNGSITLNASDNKTCAITNTVLDNMPPTVTVTFPPAVHGTNSWYNAQDRVPVIGSVTATDPSNVASITCTDTAGGLTQGALSGGGTGTASRSLTVSGDGTHDISCSATDGVSNAGAASGSTNTATLKIDTTAPTLTFGAASPAPNGAGWNNTDVSVSFAASDSTSGVASTTPASSPLVLSAEGAAVTGTVTVTDAAGNSATFTSSAVKIDKTPPTATASASPAANANGWNNTNVTVTFSGSDTLSGIDHCDSAVVLGTEGTNLTASGTCTDIAGNVSSPASKSGINIDKTPPIATANASPVPNGNGWNNTNVTVSFSGTDALSGIDHCDSTVNLTAEGINQSASGTCTDKAGNVSPTATASGINIDKTPPTLNFGAASPAPNGAGWNNTDVSISFTTADNLSGVASTSVPTPLVLASEGAAVTGTVTVTDKAGNTATFTSAAVKIDKTPPTISGMRTPGANANGWNNTDVTVSFTCGDNLSGLAAGNPPADTVLSSEGAGQSVSKTCYDLAGNSASATVSNINIDKTSPTATAAASPAPNGNGWNNTNVTVTFTGNDALSGIDFCSATANLTSEGAGQSASGTCTDKAGNVSPTATASGINIDKTPPTLNPSVSPNPVVLNGSATVSSGATDNLSGVATQGCGTLTLNAVGTKSVSCTATDKAGNSNTVSTNYSVIYASVGGLCDGDAGHLILQPINADGTSVFKWTSTSPAKFRVCDANGFSIGTAGVVSTFKLIGVTGGTVVNTVNEDVASTTPDTVFRWDPTAQQWIFNINNKGLPGGANNTYSFQITLNDNSVITFLYGLR